MKGRDTRILCRRIMAIVLCAFISFAFMPVCGFAESDIKDIPEAETIAEKTKVIEEAVDENADDSDELLMGYLNKEVSNYNAPRRSIKLRANSVPRGDRLEGINKKVYDELREQLTEFADPETTSTKEDSYFFISAEELLGREIETRLIPTAFNEETQQIEYTNVYLLSESEIAQLNTVYQNQGMIIRSLLADMPYELFWFDKASGFLVAFINDLRYPVEEGVYGFKDMPCVEARLKVSADYSASGQVGTYYFNLDTINAVKKTVNTVNSIVSTAQTNANYNSDLKKLEFYKDKVCELTEYDYETDDRPYGDPWQLINVFDGYNNTNVVCEGYSKAFQFLCDKTNFSNKKIHVFTVTGNMSGATGAGNHMWNIIQMPDGKNYMADITNSDSGMAGDNGTLFLSGAMTGGSVDTGYRYDCSAGYGVYVVSYDYNVHTRRLYDDGDLVMSESAYEEIEETENDWSFTGFEWTKTANGYTAIANYECENDSSHKDSISATVTKQELAASCNKEGNITYTATVSATTSLDSSAHTDTKVETIESLGHDFGAWSVVREATETQDGEEKSECTRCDANETKAIPSGLKVAQANARAEVESINSSDFSGAEKEAVEKAKREAIEAINNAGSIAEVGNAVQAAKDIIAKQKTDKDKAEEEKKRQAEILENEWNGILSGAVPAAKSVKAKAAKKSVKVSWKKAKKKVLKKFDKVEIQVCPDKGFQMANTKRVVVKKSKKSATVKGLTKGMTYYVRVRDVKGSGTGKLVSKWSKVKKVKIKK